MNVVFDIGNVLIHWDPRALYRKVFASEEEVSWFLEHVCNTAWNLEQDRGQSFEEAVAEATARFPDHAGAIARLQDGWDVVGRFPTTLNLPTLLDLDPGAASGPIEPASVECPLWLLRPRPQGARP